MLAAIRQAARRPKCIRSLTIPSLEKENAVLNDAMRNFGLASSSSVPPPPTSAASTPTTPVVPPEMMETMHHHIPPEQDPLLRFIATMIMRDGKYAAAARRVSLMLMNINSLTHAPPVPIVRQAVLAASPAVKCLRHKQGGKVHLKPIALSERQRTRTGIELIIEAANAKKRPGRDISERLAREMIAVVKGESSVLAKKQEIHGLAMVNRGAIMRR